MSVSDAMPTLRTSTPGAKTSTPAPKLENSARASLEASIAPTVMALGAEPGEVLAVSCCNVVSFLCRYFICSSEGESYVLITSGDDGDNAGSVDSLNSSVDSLRGGSTKGHIHNSLAGNLLLLNIVDDKLHTIENTRVATRALGVENFDSDQVDLLSYTKGGTADGTSDVAAVTVLIGILGIPY